MTLIHFELGDLDGWRNFDVEVPDEALRRAPINGRITYWRRTLNDDRFRGNAMVETYLGGALWTTTSLRRRGESLPAS